MSGAFCGAPPLRAQGVITTVVGTEWVFAGDGKPALNVPLGLVASVTLDRTGALVLADYGNAVVLRLNPDGSVKVLAGNGLQAYSGDGGTALNAALNSPHSVAFDSKGNLYIADLANNRIRMVTPAGIITTVAGDGVGRFAGDNGPASLASLNLPNALAIDSLDTIYISDSSNARIRRITADGKISTWAGGGQDSTGNGIAATKAALNDVENMAVDGKGNLYLAEFGSNRIRKIDANGIITTIAGDGQARYFGDNVSAVTASLQNPGGVAVDNLGNVYVADTGNEVIRKINSQGIISRIAGIRDTKGLSGDNGPALNATFNSVFGLVVDAAGTVYAADRDNGRIRKINSAQIISTVAGNGLFEAFPDGTSAADAFLFNPFGISFDTPGNLYIADTMNNRVLRVTPDNRISKIAGNGGGQFGGDGGPAALAGLFAPFSVTPDKFGNLYIADTGNNLIRKVQSNGVITTVAGNANSTVPFAGDGGKATAAALNQPQQVAIDAAGNLYIADTGNNRIRKVTADGNISTIAGNNQAGFAGEGGPATQASLSSPTGVAFDGLGNLYIADFGNSRIRRITTDGRISTVAGGGTRPDTTADSFPATQAQLGRPIGIAVDVTGNFYFSDARTHRVRMVSAAGIISTVAGTGNVDFTGDGGPATQASLDFPDGLALDAAGNLLIADTLNNRVRKVQVAVPTLQLSSLSLSFSASGDGALTGAQSIDIVGSVFGLQYTAQTSTDDGGNWLKLSSTSGAAPATIQVAIDPTGLAPGTHQATIVVTSPNAIPRTSSVAVTLAVAAPQVPVLSVGTQTLSFSSLQNGPATTQLMSVSNQGGGSLNFTTSAVADSDGNWLSVTPGLGAATAVQATWITVQADPTGLDGGTYTGTITVNGGDVAGTVTIPVSMTVIPVIRKLVLSQSALRFTTIAGGGAPLPQDFGVLSAGDAVLSWNAQASTQSGGSDWLTVSPASGVTSSGGTAPLVEVRVKPGNLAAGDYSGQVLVSSTDADNSPQTVPVLLSIQAPPPPPPPPDPGPVPPPNPNPPSPISLDVQPSGLLFSGPAGSSPGSQTIVVSNPAGVSTTYASQRATQDGQNWFVNAPTNALVPPDQPVKVVVQPDFTKLAPGTYNGTLTLSFSGGLQTVNIVSVVTDKPTVGNCKPQQLTIQFGTPIANFGLPASQPATIEVVVSDNCGTPLQGGPAAKVKARFSTGDPDLDFVAIGNGHWRATWKPQNATPGPVRIEIDAFETLSSTAPSITGQALLSGTLQ